MSSPEDDAPRRLALAAQETESSEPARVRPVQAEERQRFAEAREMLDVRGKRGPRKGWSLLLDVWCRSPDGLERYVDTLEARLEKMEGLLKKAYPEDGDSPSKEGTMRAHSADFARLSPARGVTTTTHSSPGATEDHDFSDDCYEPSELVQHKLSALCLHPMSNRFFGKSSGATLLQTALDLKSEYSGVKQEPMGHLGSSRRRDAWAMHPVRLSHPLRPASADPIRRRAVGNRELPAAVARVRLPAAGPARR
ncbi:hypothetical protein EVG20_g11630, partial [Dentipellis fragilis]